MEELSVPPEGTAALSFPTRYSRNFMGQFRICLWKKNAVYWRSPEYNSVRFLFTFLLAILFGAPSPPPSPSLPPRGRRDGVHALLNSRIWAAV